MINEFSIKILKSKSIFTVLHSWTVPATVSFAAPMVIAMQHPFWDVITSNTTGLKAGKVK
jgi:hypothetical protein